MTDMDYKEKYESSKTSAIKRYEAGFMSKEDVEAIFPDAFESEDKRITRAINNMLPFIPDMAYTNNGVTKEDVLTWLEKMKEQSMSVEEVLIRAGLKPYKDGNKWCILAGDNIQEGICGFGDTIDEALYQFLMEVLEKQKEQDSTQFEEGFKTGRESGLRDGQKYVLNNLDSYGLCRFAEWSEEDEKQIRQIERIAKEAGCTPQLQKQIHNFLKSLSAKIK